MRRNRMRMSTVRIGCLLAVILAAAADVPAEEPNSESTKDKPVDAVTLSLDPERPVTGDRVRANVKLRDSFLRAEVQWALNGDTVQTDAVLSVDEAIELKRDVRVGDKIEVVATVFDARTREEVTRVSKRVLCRNAGPTLQIEDQKLEGHVYTATVKAHDPEGDPITLTLKTAPSGMTMDSKGKIVWKFDSNTKGKFTVVVSAKDDKGVEAVLTYTFVLRSK